MKATIKIEMDNAAFEDAPELELARILRGLAEQLNHGSLHDRGMYDANGNAVGTFKITGKQLVN